MASPQKCRPNATRIPAPKKQPKSAIHLKVSDRELLAVYQDHVDGDADIERVRDAFLGNFDSEEAWAADWLEQTGSLQDG